MWQPCLWSRGLKSKWCLVLEKQSHLFRKAKSSSFDVEGTSCCSEGGSRELIKSAEQANLDKTVMKWYIEQHFCTSTCNVGKDCFVLKIVGHGCFFYNFAPISEPPCPGHLSKFIY